MYKKLVSDKFLNLYPVIYLKHGQIYQCNRDQIDNVTLLVVTVNYPTVIFILLFLEIFQNFVSI